MLSAGEATVLPSYALSGAVALALKGFGVMFDDVTAVVSWV